MATMVVLHVKGGTLEQYDQTNMELFGKMVPDELPDGLLSHVCAGTEDGVKVVDVWESKDKFLKFGEVLMPALHKANVPQTEPKFYEVHNFFKA